MGMCIYICINIMYIHIIWICIYMIHKHVQTHTHKNVGGWMHFIIFTQRRAFDPESINIYIHIYIYIYIYLHTYIYTYIYLYIAAYIFLYIYGNYI